MPDGSLQGISSAVIAGAGIVSAATPATVLGCSAYPVLRSLRETLSLQLIERLRR